MDIYRAKEEMRTMQAPIKTLIGEASWYGFPNSNFGTRGALAQIKMKIDNCYKYLGFCPCCKRKL